MSFTQNHRQWHEPSSVYHCGNSEDVRTVMHRRMNQCVLYMFKVLGKYILKCCCQTHKQNMVQSKETKFICKVLLFCCFLDDNGKMLMNTQMRIYFCQQPMEPFTSSPGSYTISHGTIGIEYLDSWHCSSKWNQPAAQLDLWVVS